MGPQQFLQDDSGANSVKRLAFFVFVLLYVSMAIVPLWVGADAVYVLTVLDKTKDIIFWLGAYILAENVAPILKSK